MTVMDLPKISKRPLKRWTVDEYNVLVERGALEGQRIYLYRGEIFEMPAMGAMHRLAVRNVNYWLNDVMRPDFDVQIQEPINILGNSAPEPDAAVFTHAQCDRMPHPTEAELLIEISDSSLDLDHEKAFDYAAAQVPEYWIIDVVTRTATIHRDPISDPSAPLGFRYSFRKIFKEDEPITARLKPDAVVTVKSLLTTTYVARK